MPTIKTKSNFTMHVNVKESVAVVCKIQVQVGM